MTQKLKERSTLFYFNSLFLLLFVCFHLACQNKQDYVYLTGEGRCANGKQDPDEFGVDCGGACPNDCQDVRYLEGEIFGRLSLDTRYDYILTGPLVVRDQASLEFPSGTHLKVQADAGAYIAVAQGGLLFVWGTADNPVTISSNSPEPGAGDWGGIIFCGQAPLEDNSRQLSPLGNFYYGGNNTNDSSGYLRYLKVQHAGAAYDETLSYSALNFYGAGRSTVVNHLWVDNVLHQGIAITGGNIEMEDVVVTAAQQNALSLSSNWDGRGNRLYLHDSGVNGLLFQDSFTSPTVTSSFSLSNVSIYNASNSGIKFMSTAIQASFDRFILSNLPTAFQFEANFPFQWSDFYLENVPVISNDEDFNRQFQALSTPPFSNGDQLPDWVNHWED